MCITARNGLWLETQIILLSPPVCTYIPTRHVQERSGCNRWSALTVLNSPTMKEMRVAMWVSSYLHITTTVQQFIEQRKWIVQCNFKFRSSCSPWTSTSHAYTLLCTALISTCHRCIHHCQQKACTLLPFLRLSLPLLQPIRTNR